jgi:hypothetical protein
MLQGEDHDRVNAGHFNGDHSDCLRHRDTGDPCESGAAYQVVRETQYPLMTAALAVVGSEEWHRTGDAPALFESA